MKCERIPWSEEAENALAPALEYADVRDCIKSEVEREQAELWRIDGRSYLVTRREGSEIVVVAYSGTQLRAAARAIVAAAWRAGYASIRFHTQSQALIRMMREFAPEPVEYVVRVYNGRKKQKRDDHAAEHDQRPGHRHDDDRS